MQIKRMHNVNYENNFNFERQCWTALFHKCTTTYTIYRRPHTFGDRARHMRKKPF